LNLEREQFRVAQMESKTDSFSLQRLEAAVTAPARAQPQLVAFRAFR
jgi:hypothetical protein